MPAPAPYQRPVSSAPSISFEEESGANRKVHRVAIYAEGGMGKSTLVSLLQGVTIADIELSTADLDVKRVKNIIAYGSGGAIDGAASWERLRAWVKQFRGFAACIDSLTRAEDWCAAWVIKNRKGPEAAADAVTLEEFKYKSGTGYVVEEFKGLLNDLDKLYINGSHVVCVCHADTLKYTNPEGANYFRISPRLIDDEKKGSNMKALVERMDHVVYIGLDTDVNKGKATGCGSRTLYASRTPTIIAKSRTLPSEPVPYVLGGDTDLWKMLGIK